MTKSISSETLVGTEQNVPVANGEKETAQKVDEGFAPLHDVLNEALGTTFSTPDDAIKGIKDTMTFVGKAGKGIKALEAVTKAKGLTEDDAVKFIMDNLNPENQNLPVGTQPPAGQSEQPVDTSKFVSRDEFEANNYYGAHPELVPVKEVIDGLAKSSGKTRDEVVQMEPVKALLEAKTAQDESTKSKSALIGNGKLGTIADKMTQAHEAQKSGNMEAAAKAATAAVLETIDVK